MAEAEGQKVISLAEQWSLPKEEEPTQIEASVEPTQIEAAVEPTQIEAAVEPTQIEATVEPTQIEAAVENVNDENPAAATPDSVLIEKPNEVPSAEDITAAAEENSKTPEPEESEAEETTEEEKPELKLETAPADFRFPTTNQTKHCFTRYIEYHRCIATKGDDAPECAKFAKYYRALCPGEWIDRWNEQVENGTFPGPL